MDENEKRPERLISSAIKGTTQKYKKPLAKRLVECFINPDIEDIPKWLFTSVIVPAICDAIVEAVENLFDQGLSTSRSRSRSKQIKERSSLDEDYTRYYKNSSSSKPEHSKSSEIEYFVMDRADAEDAADQLYYLLNKYNRVRVADYKDAIDKTPVYTDNDWGWTTLPDKIVRRARGGGWYLDLPRPKSLK